MGPDRTTLATSSAASIPVVCPGCGSTALEPAGLDGVVRRVCEGCGSCWEEDGQDWRAVESPGCPGCARRGVCESRPTWLAESMTQHSTLADGTKVMVRPLLYGDRFELADAFEQLSMSARRMRFFMPPEHLDEGNLEYLTNLDYHDHFAWAAFAEDEPGRPGIGVARYIRVRDAPEAAEVAVTVLDAYQRRGLGTLLLRLLADVAADKGVRTFISYVRWDNVGAVAGLADEGARINPDEPGVARIEIDLPTPGAAYEDRVLRRVLHTFAQYLREVLERFPIVP
jgi:RimJ/RimL family protein N-acetyltransferase